MSPNAPYPPIDPAIALSCPRCKAPAQPSSAVQRCGRCDGAFTLHVGWALDPSTPLPPFDRALPAIKVKSSVQMVLQTGLVAAEGIMLGELDPVMGLISTNQSGVMFPDVGSVAVYRTVDVVSIVVAALLPLPIAVGLTMIGLQANSAAGFLVVAGLFGLLTAWMVYRAAFIKKHWVRIVGRYRTIEIRFDTPLRRRRAFHGELLRRAGIAPAPIP
jgi:hypothetical protein